MSAADGLNPRGLPGTLRVPTRRVPEGRRLPVSPATAVRDPEKIPDPGAQVSNQRVKA